MFAFVALLTFCLVLLGNCVGEEVSDSKRLLANDPEIILKELNALKTEMSDLKNSNTVLKTEMADLKHSNEVLRNSNIVLQNSNTVLQNTVSKIQSREKSGAVYTRWGKKNCSGNMTQLVYTGFFAGPAYTDTGSAANYLCLPTDPLWGTYSDSVDNMGKIYGAEYEWLQFNHGLHDENPPCAVCRTGAASTVVMIPARNKCYPGWKIEYYGYLVSDDHSNRSPTQYICLDSNPDVLYAGHGDENGAVLYSVEGICGSLPCPPYVNGRELTCVVCSK